MHFHYPVSALQSTYCQNDAVPSLNKTREHKPRVHMEGIVLLQGIHARQIQRLGAGRSEKLPRSSTREATVG